MSTAKVKNYSTTVDYHKSIAEIEAILARHGCMQVSKSYEDGKPVSLYFTMPIRGVPVNFKMPCNHHRVRVMLERTNAPRRLQEPEHALRVAWRTLKDWVDAQTALIQTEMVEMQDVMLPFLVVDREGLALYESASAMTKLLPPRQEKS